MSLLTPESHSIQTGSLLFCEASTLDDFLPDRDFAYHARAQVVRPFIFHQEARVEHFFFYVRFRRIARVSSLMRLMISGGVPDGARNICDVSTTALGTPASCIVGTSGRSTQCSAPVCASAFSAPERIWPISPAMLTEAISVVPCRAA